MADNTISLLEGKLNTALGLEYCGELDDLYLEMLQDYVDGDKTALLQEYYNGEQWSDYVVQIHAVKSTTLMIGGEALSAKAKDLEMAARESNAAFIHANHDAVMAEYAQLIADIKAAL